MKLTIKDIKTAKVFDVEIAAEPVSVEVLKLAIQASQRIEVANQKLVFKGKTLREGVKLGDVGVENGATVHLVLKLASALGEAPAAADPDRFTLNIKNLKTRTTFAVELGADPTVAQVKEAIAAHMPDVAPDHQRLVFGGKSLADGALRDAGVASGQTVHLVLRLKTTVELRVRVMSGAELTWDTAKTASVDDALAAVHELLNLDARPRVLCVDGRPLDAAGAIDQHGPLAHRQLLHLVLAPAPGADSLYDHLGAGADADAARCYGLAGSLYARCGGIFGVASFVDACMDAWMAEPTLNANEMVANWHEKAQRCGFKFLVTQLISYQCGGPQVYTGRDMAASHKHLSISPEEWAAFIDSLHEVCDELGLPKQETDDVAAVVASMRAGCTLAEGEEAPPNPGPPPPSRCLPTSLYARLGGCYPLALFSDRLVDALLGDSSVVITVSDERTMPALKYLFTELCCEIAGGPEVMTAPSLHTARLQLRPLDFVKMLGCVKSAADHLDDDADVAARHAAELAQALHKRSDLILSKPLPWRERAPALRDAFNHRARGPRSPRSHQGGPTHQEVREAVEKIGQEWGATLLYVPTGGGAGFLLIVEQGEASRHELVRQLRQLGFGEAFGDVMTMGSVTNKDLLFCIDISGSMKTNSRIQNAANNAVRVYDNYTTPDDSVGLIWFDSKVEVKAPLGPRDKSGLRSLIDSTRDALRGATAFYDALIAACQVSANSRSRSPPPPFLFPRGDRIFP